MEELLLNQVSFFRRGFHTWHWNTAPGICSAQTHPVGLCFPREALSRFHLRTRLLDLLVDVAPFLQSFSCCTGLRSPFATCQIHQVQLTHSFPGGLSGYKNKPNWRDIQVHLKKRIKNILWKQLQWGVKWWTWNEKGTFDRHFKYYAITIRA